MLQNMIEEEEEKSGKKGRGRAGTILGRPAPQIAQFVVQVYPPWSGQGPPSFTSGRRAWILASGAWAAWATANIEEVLKVFTCGLFVFREKSNLT